MSNIKGAKSKSKTQAIISTAFQDHITKQLRLDHLINANLIAHTTTPAYKIPTKVKSKVDTGLNKKKSTQTNSNKNLADLEKEYVIDNSKSDAKEVPTLAEKFGLVPVKKRSDLDESEWFQVKEAYRKREDYKQPCVICKEPLGALQQVLLSCSHTFHRNCLEMFEKFSGKKSCPMCRKEKYQARVVFDASKHHKHLCAARIQAAWRGYLVRKWYLNYRKLVPPQNPQLRKKFFEEKLSDITSRIVTSFNFDTDLLLDDIDRNIKESRETFKNFDINLRPMFDEQWSELLRKAITREHDECSICMNQYEIPKSCCIHTNETREIQEKVKPKTKFTMLTQLAEEEENDAKNKPVVLLSCSHVFHAVCLETFEELNFDKLSVCPECRSVYKKKQLN